MKTPSRFIITVALAGVAASLARCGGRDEPRSPDRGFSAAAMDTLTPPGPDGLRHREVVTRAYPLPPERVALHAEPFPIEPFHPGERAWILSWESNTEDPQGNREPDDIHCHATLSEAVLTAESAAFVGVYTDGFTPSFRLPAGFGVPIAAGRRLVFQPMFNNRHPHGRSSRMRIRVDYVLEDEARARDLRPLMGFVVSVVKPELYWVKPGDTDVRRRTFRMPVTGRVHAAGAHLHPHGRWVDLRRERDRATLLTTRMNDATDVADQRLSTYVSEEGFFVREGDEYSVGVEYANPTDRAIDAMAGLFVFYDPAGKPDA